MIFVVLLVVIVAAVSHAPASWLDEAIRIGTQNRVRLAQASGTLWQGQAYPVLRLSDAATITQASDSNLQLTTRKSIGQASEVFGLSLPHPVQWRLNPFAAIVGEAGLELSIQGIDRPLRVVWRDGFFQLPAGQINLPRLDFSALGSPWNSLQPSALIELRWTSLKLTPKLESNVMITSGRLSVILSDVALSISPVRPLGSYELNIELGRNHHWDLRTIDGFLHLKAMQDGQSGVRIEARPQASEEKRLRPLLSLMGQQDGDATILRLIP